MEKGCPSSEIGIFVFYTGCDAFSEESTMWLSDAFTEPGLEDGRKAGVKSGKMEIAIKMKEMGLFAEIICEATGLTATEIESL